MKKYNQSGLAHPLLIAGLVLTFVVVGFSAYRIGQSNSNENANAQDENTVETAEPIAVNEEKTEEITLPAEEKEAETVATAPKEVKKTEPAPANEVKKDKIYLEMVNVSASQDGSVVYVTSRLPSAQSGKCNFKLYQEGYEKVYSSSQISGSTDCVGQLDVSSMPTYDGWELHVWFDGSDGKTFGYQKEAAFPLTDPN